MKSPIILEGVPFPWNEPNPYGAVVNDAGKVNWAAAASADPGVMKCPGCGVYLWNEGIQVRCPDCLHEFITSAGMWHAQRTEEAKRGGR